MTLLDDYLNVDTPENVTFGYDVAGIGSRFIAALVDSLIILALQILVGLLVFVLMRALLGDRELSQVWVWVAATLGLVAFAFLWGYYIFFEMTWNGQSPGKRWMGLRVVCVDGTPITLSESIIRNVIRLIDFLPAYYGVGVVTMFIDGQARRLGDLAAGTLVVQDRRPISLESLVFKVPPSDQGSLTLDWPLERLTTQDIQTAEEFLRRRAEFSNRSELAYRLARTLFQRMGLPTEQLAGYEAEALLVEIVQASRSRLEP